MYDSNPGVISQSNNFEVKTQCYSFEESVLQCPCPIEITHNSFICKYKFKSAKFEKIFSNIRLRRKS